ncbi:MAG: DUF1937 family protein [Candidatus Odinarchaeota archaeon]
MPSKLYYVAHPYTYNENNNFEKVNRICNELIDLGYIILSPISMNHPLHQLKQREKDFWYGFDLKLLERCDGIILCQGWEASRGCCIEFERGKRLGMEILYHKDIVDGGKKENE